MIPGVQRVLFVVPRFGTGIVGGAEAHIRGLALQSAGMGIEVSIATTCAVDHTTWRNALPPGATTDGPLQVLRFSVSPRDTDLHAQLHARLHREGRLTYIDELALMGSSVWSADLQHFLETTGHTFDLLVFSPYLFGTSFWGAQAWPERTVLMPCLHDEPEAHMRCLHDAFGSVAGWMFNTPAEERLVRSLYDVRHGAVVGMGFESSPMLPRGEFSRRRSLGPYLLYAGRLEEGKGVHVATEYMSRFRHETGMDVRLALMGRGSYRPPAHLRDSTIDLGFLDDTDKRHAYRDAVALVNPSRLESLSLVLLEAWREGTPAIVTAASDVMTEHCMRSGGGFTFIDYPEFAAAASSLINDHVVRDRMGAAGRAYVQHEYNWPSVAERLSGLFRALRA